MLRCVVGPAIPRPVRVLERLDLEDRDTTEIRNFYKLLVSFHCKQNTFRKRVKNVVTSKEIQMGIEFQ
jgi:hypothetical protein